MDGSLIVEAYKELFQLYQKIDTCQAVLETTDVPELRRAMQKSQAQAIREFEAILDNQIDGRLAELMDIARQELVKAEQAEQKSKQKQQRIRTPQLVSVK